MAITVQQAVTGSWVKISEGDCTIQSVKAGTLYNISVGTPAPTEAALALKLDEPTTFAYKSPVWARLNAKGNAGMSSTINVIK